MKRDRKVKTVEAVEEKVSAKRPETPALIEITPAMLLKEELRQRIDEKALRQWRPAVTVHPDIKKVGAKLEAKESDPLPKKPVKTIRPNPFRRPAITIRNITVVWDLPSLFFLSEKQSF